jgi:diguanylate cyclase (GGDEF)-like protein
VASHCGGELPGHSAYDVAGAAAAASAQARLRQDLPDLEALHRAVEGSRQQLQAALRRIDELLGRELSLERQVALLEQEAENARRFAFHDELTGLPNRRLLLDRFSQVIAREAREHKQVVLLFIDIDGFKRLNDEFGHVVGDRVLEQVAARLTAYIRVSDTACRYGGDEFVVLLPDYISHGQAVAATENIHARLAEPYAAGGSAITIRASIGVAVFPTDGCELDDLIQAADRAMYREKNRERTLRNVLEHRPRKQPLCTSST